MLLNFDYTHTTTQSLMIHSSGGSSGRRSGDRHPLVNFFFNFFSVETKREAPRIRFENRFLIVIAVPSTNRHPLTDFLDPPLDVGIFE
jgi:hypothetical protein